MAPSRWLLVLLLLCVFVGCAEPEPEAEVQAPRPYDASAVIPAAAPTNVSGSVAPIVLAVAEVNVPYTRAGFIVPKVLSVVAVHADGVVMVARPPEPEAECGDTATLFAFLEASATAPNATVPATWVDQYPDVCVVRTVQIPEGAWAWIAAGFDGRVQTLAAKTAEEDWRSRAGRNESCDGCYVALHVEGNAGAARPAYLEQQAATPSDPGLALAAAAALYAEAAALQDWAG